MLHQLRRFIPKRLLNPYIPETEAGAAYDIWSENYDNQPGNLMLDLDEIIFSRMLARTDIKGKKVADIGCGTGRHWPKIMQRQPLELAGFDVSSGMLSKLKQKFPEYETHQIINNRMPNVSTDAFDVVVSTLTMAHIKNLDDALLNWCRIVKNNGDILITDFHPDALANGGQRTFKHGNGHIAVRNFVHRLDEIEAVLGSKKWKVIHREQIVIDATLKHYYESNNALHVYDKFKGMPIIYGLHFKHEA